MIAATPERTAMRDELVREVADRLDVPASTCAPRAASRVQPLRRPRSRQAPRRARSRSARSASSSLLPGQRRARSSATWRCRPTSTSRPRRCCSARGHLLAALRRPARRLSQRTTPRLARSSATWSTPRRSSPPQPESVLRMSILQLERRRIEREIRRATQEGDHALSHASWPRPSSAVRERVGPGHGTDGVSDSTTESSRASTPRTSRRRGGAPTSTTSAVSSPPACRWRRPSRGPRTRSASTCGRSAACRCSRARTRCASPSASSRTTCRRRTR